MKFCPYCGKELPDEMDFCLYCMKKLTKEIEINTTGKTFKIRSKQIIYIPMVIIITIIVVVLGINIKKNSLNKSSEAINNSKITSSNIQKNKNTITSNKVITQTTKRNTSSDISKSTIKNTTNSTTTTSSNKKDTSEAGIEPSAFKSALINNTSSAQNNCSGLTNYEELKITSDMITLSSQSSNTTKWIVKVNNSCSASIEYKNDGSSFTIFINGITNNKAILLFDMVRISLGGSCYDSSSANALYNALRDLETSVNGKSNDLCYTFKTEYLTDVINLNIYGEFK